MAVIVAAAGGLAAAIAFGGPKSLPPMRSVSDPFKSVDFSDLPAIERYSARDGSQLAFRTYRSAEPTAKGTVVVIHGSSARSDSMHLLAKGLAAAGYVVHALDVRGHGESGTKGQVVYIGQLEDDLDDFMRSVRPTGTKSLVGFSAGGGFALRFAADERRAVFDNYVLLSPFLSQDASTYRPASGGWVSVGIPRAIGLTIVNSLGVSAFNHLPLIRFALRPEAEKFLTPYYAFGLAANFRPRSDYRADIAAASQPMEVLVGGADDQFYPDRFAAEFARPGRAVPVTIVPALGHIDLTISPQAIASLVEVIARLDRNGNSAR